MGSNGKKTLVIRNGTLIDGSGNPPAQNDAVVVDGNRITSVGHVPAGLNLEDRDKVQVIDAAGQYVMPGLIDAHVHLSFGGGDPRGIKVRDTTSAEFGTLRATRNAQRVLRTGVTSISVPGGTWFTDVAVRDAINVGLIEGPRIYCAGRLISATGGAGDREPSWVGSPDHASGIVCNGIEAMVTEVRRQCKHGVNFIKLLDSEWGDFQAISTEELSAVVDEAHRRNVRVAIHSRGSGSTRAAAEAGVDWMFHADLATEADLDLVAESGVPIMPVFTSVFIGIEHGGDFGLSERARDIMKGQMEHATRVGERAKGLGTTLLSGTDTGNSYAREYGKHHGYEAEIMVKHVGLSPMEAIVANTSQNAWAVGLENEVGILEPGKLADVIVLKEDPLADIRVLRDPKNVATVIKDGRIIDGAGENWEEDMVSFRPAMS
jgi:imidazolonepropionase-like amidohydrolase